MIKLFCFLSKSPIALFPCLILLLLSGGCGTADQDLTSGQENGDIIQIDKESGPNPWTHLDFKNNPDDFQFAIISDLTGRLRPNVFPEAIKKLNLLQPEFVMTMGDVIEGHTSDPAQLNREWTQLFKAVEPLEMPLFWLPGNHDYWYQSRQNAAREFRVYDMREVYKERVGRPWYHFVYRNVLFMILANTMIDPIEIEQEKQYIKATLEQNKEVKWTFTFFHYDIFKSTSTTAAIGSGNLWGYMEPLLADRPYTAFAGNSHTYSKYNVGKGKEMVRLATTGGMSRMRGVQYGEFDHIMWVTMTDDGPKLSNLMLEGIYDSNVRTDKSEQMTALLLDGMRKENVGQLPVNTKPVLVKGQEFSGATITTVKLINSGDLPLHIQGTFEPNRQLLPDPASFDINVPANSEKDVDVNLGIHKTTSIYDISPLVLNWKAAYSLPGDDPDVEVNGKNRIIMDTQGERPPSQRPVITETFSGKLEAAWIPLGPGGRFNDQGQFELRDNPTPLAAERKDAQGRYTDGPMFETAVHTPVEKRPYRFIDGRGVFSMTPLFQLPVNGIYRDIPPDTFTADLKISQIQPTGKNPELHWEFWDGPDQTYNYGPIYLSGIILTLSQEFGTYVLKLRQFKRNGLAVLENKVEFTGISEVKLDKLPSSLALKANWRESSKTWQFFYGIDGTEAINQFPGGKFVEDMSLSPDGKRNMIYVHRDYDQGGFSVVLDEYRLSH